MPFVVALSLSSRNFLIFFNVLFRLEVVRNLVIHLGSARCEFEFPVFPSADTYLLFEGELLVVVVKVMIARDSKCFFLGNELGIGAKSYSRREDGSQKLGVNLLVDLFSFD